MKLLAETFQRKLVLTDFRRWFVNNIQFFVTPVEQPIIIIAENVKTDAISAPSE